jgi:hypothetical protein
MKLFFLNKKKLKNIRCDSVHRIANKLLVWCTVVRRTFSYGKTLQLIIIGQHERSSGFSVDFAFLSVCNSCGTSLFGTGKYVLFGGYAESRHLFSCTSRAGSMPDQVF